MKRPSKIAVTERVHTLEDEMAKKKRSARLSAGELRLMGVLWERGPMSLAEAYQSQPGQLGYTTIQTQLNRLVDKGVASRTKVRPMKYRALVNPREAGSVLLQLLIDTVGGGSIIPLVSQLLHHEALSKEDARQLKQLIHDASPKPPKVAKRGAKRDRKGT